MSLRETLPGEGGDLPARPGYCRMIDTRVVPGMLVQFNLSDDGAIVVWSQAIIHVPGEPGLRLLNIGEPFQGPEGTVVACAVKLHGESAPRILLVER